MGAELGSMLASGVETKVRNSDGRVRLVLATNCVNEED